MSISATATATCTVSLMISLLQGRKSVADWIKIVIIDDGLFVIHLHHPLLHPHEESFT